MKLIIVSNRLPVTVKEQNNRYKITPSAGGLTTGLNSLETTMEKHWVGWPGLYLENEKEKAKINLHLKALNFHPVYLTPTQIENYYEGYSNSIIWPLSHYFFSHVRYKNEYWESYKEVNRLFCERVVEVIEPGDIVWVQDYQLMLLPQMIRDVQPNINIGYFHHIPFPSYELFRCLPERAEILEGLLGADLLAFHTHSYMRHFISAIYRVLRQDCVLDEIYLEDRVVDIDAFPMGINYDQYNNALDNPKIAQRAAKLRKGLGNAKLILSVDRLDYSKGIVMRLASFEKLLENYPQYHSKVSLVMIVAPSRDSVDIYAALKEEIDKKVGAINGKYSTAHWTPVHYFYRSFDFNDVVALYSIADIGLVTPFRDGMNLVAKEFIATKRDGKGVLILSEMAGAAAELTDAIIVNPNDAKDIEQAFVKALEMPEEEQEIAVRKMQKIISAQDVGQWAKDFVAELVNVKEKNRVLQQKVIKEEQFDYIKEAYDKASNRLIILDYDGTLSPFFNDPMKAKPTRKTLTLLERIASDKHNKTVISSGRKRQTLDDWFGHLPIGLAAEHGAFHKKEGEWVSKVPSIEWDGEIVEIMQHVVRKAPLSKLEIKDTALVWHYRNVDVWLAELRVTQLINALINPCSRLGLQIMKGNKVVEVKYSDCNKGSEALRLLEESDYDFVMAIGDDTTDEDMFAALPETAFTIKVGKTSNSARFTLPHQKEVITFLDNLTK